MIYYLITLTIIVIPLACLGGYIIALGLFKGMKGLNGWRYLNAVTKTIHVPEHMLKPEHYKKLNTDWDGDEN